MKILLLSALCIVSFQSVLFAQYAIVVSKETNADADWQKVVAALQAKYPDAKVCEYDANVNDLLPELQKHFPRHACFVATSQEAGREFVANVHRLTRKLDDDPYTDCLWGILTGFDAANALEIAQEREPLVVRKAASGTEIALEKLDAGQWYCELTKNKHVQKEAGGEVKEVGGLADTTKALVDSLVEYKPDLFVTSGHATERDWQIGFRYRNGYFRSQAGKMFGVDIAGEKFPLVSPNPKVYLPIGNCLMGHIDGPDAMALAWMKSVGVRQMMGYTVNTWYGYGGWGVLDYFVEQPGRYDLADAFYANEQALLYRLETYFPDSREIAINAAGYPVKAPALTPQARAAGLSAQDGVGLLYDRDAVAFYGDPAWDARLADATRSYEQSLTEKDGEYTFTITPKLGEKSFEPVNTNGSQRGYRPMIELLPQRIKEIKIVAGADLNPVITDNFILVPNPRKCDPNRTYEVKFTAKPVK